MTSGELPTQPTAPQAPISQPEAYTVFIRGIPRGTDEQMILELFRPFGTIVNIRIPAGRKYCFIDYDNQDSADQAIFVMHKHNFHNSEILVEDARYRDPVTTPRPQGPSHPPHRRGRRSYSRHHRDPPSDYDDHHDHYRRYDDRRYHS
jgi:RNA recognition motif-containing protein